VRNWWFRRVEGGGGWRSEEVRGGGRRAVGGGGRGKEGREEKVDGRGGLKEGVAVGPVMGRVGLRGGRGVVGGGEVRERG